MFLFESWALTLEYLHLVTLCFEFCVVHFRPAAVYIWPSPLRIWNQNTKKPWADWLGACWVTVYTQYSTCTLIVLLFTFICTIIIFTVITLGKEPVPEEYSPSFTSRQNEAKQGYTALAPDPGPGPGSGTRCSFEASHCFSWCNMLWVNFHINSINTRILFMFRYQTVLSSESPKPTSPEIWSILQMVCSTFAEVGSKEQFRLHVVYGGTSHHPVVLQRGYKL